MDVVPVDRIWFWVSCNEIPIYIIFYLLKGGYEDIQDDVEAWCWDLPDFGKGEGMNSGFKAPGVHPEPERGWERPACRTSRAPRLLTFAVSLTRCSF